MKRTKFLFVILILISAITACKAKQKRPVSNGNSTADQQKQRSFILQVDPSFQTLLENIRKVLLLPNASTGEVYFNPGPENSLLGITNGLPNLQFSEKNYKTAFLSASEWLKFSENQPLPLGLFLDYRNFGKRKLNVNSTSSPTVNPQTIFEILRARMENFPEPTQFKILPSFAAIPDRTSQPDPSLPYFFLLESSYPAKSLFAETCNKIEAYLSALQLSKGIKPEASIAVYMDCSIRLASRESIPSSEQLLSLPFPWKRGDSTEPMFQSFEKFLDSENYSL